MAQQRTRGFGRLWVPTAVIGLFAIMAMLRLAQVQILQHDSYAKTAEDELRAVQQVFGRRGAILDRHGNVLATSVDTWDIYVSAQAWKDPARAEKAAAEVAKALRIDKDQLKATVRAHAFGDVLVSRDAAYETGRALLDAQVAGVVALPNSARVNPDGDTGASLLGITGAENTGLAGIEASQNEILQGKAGRAIFERDTTGEPIPFGTHVTEDPEQGRDLILTIDRYLQQLVERELDAAVKEHRARGGTIIIMDPNSGEVLAQATTPRLKFSTLDLSDPNQMELLKNTAVTDLYEPGSVMKVITAASAINAGAVTPETTYVDTGVIHIYETTLRNWDSRVYGEQTMTGVLQNSINTGAVTMMQWMGERKFVAYLDKFGFGKPTGIELQGEPGGIFRKPGDRGWSPVDAATQSFGQAISVTPIQMVTAFAAAINGGNLLKPRLVKGVVGADGHVQATAPAIVSQPIRPETSAQLRYMLEQVVMPPERYHQGRPKLYTAGGKSGTANIPVSNGYNDRQIASFIGFAPVESPRVVILVKLDDNADGLTGQVAAGPVFAHLVDQVLTYLDVPPAAVARVEVSR